MSDVPIPYVNELPEDAMSRALSLIRLAQEALTSDVMSIAEQDDINCAMSVATELLRPIYRYLELDERRETRGLYQAARRAEVMTYGGNE